MFHALPSLALLVALGNLCRADEIPTPRTPPQTTIAGQRPPQAPPAVAVAKPSYGHGYHEALKTGKTLIVAVGCSCPDVPNCVCCEVSALEGFGVGVHVATVNNGTLYHVGTLGVAATGGNSYHPSSGGFQSGGGSCAGGSCGTPTTTRGPRIFFE